MSYETAKQQAVESKLGFVKFLAMDGNGQWRGFSARPVADKETKKWNSPGFITISLCQNTDKNQLWLNSLRPFSLPVDPAGSSANTKKGK